MDELSGTAPLNISLADTASGPVIRAEGELDASNIHRLRSLVDSHLDSRPGNLLFEFAGVTFMDTSVIALLIQTTKRGVPVRILNPSVQVRTVIEMTGLGGILVMEP
jgi:anti-anti-sigma factor